jgi:murein DD-endopeptidase MepM/ murein hydrolase activator NlpD
VHRISFKERVTRGAVRLPRARLRMFIIAGVAADALLAMTGATALVPHRAQLEATALRAATPAVPRATAQATAPQKASQLAESDPTARRFTGRVGPDLSQSLLAAGVPEAQGKEYVAILGRAIQLADGLSVDDKFDLVLQREPDGKLGQLLYVGLDRIARADVELLKWTDGKNIIWVNADGVGGEEQSRIGMPVHGRLTSGFGERFHPILGYMRFHKGADLAAPAGTPIVAAADGKVVGAGWHGGYGEQVQIAHAGGLETTYGHMSRIAARVGEIVRKGEVIGYVGSTGLSTGPHVHFEVTRNGRPINPMSVKMGGGPGHLEGAKLHAFQGELRNLLLAGSS